MVIGASYMVTPILSNAKYPLHLPVHMKPNIDFFIFCSAHYFKLKLNSEGKTYIKLSCGEEEVLQEFIFITPEKQNKRSDQT